MSQKVKYNLAAPLKFVSRQHDESYDSMPYRDDFQRDRDRILYSKEFRRLSGKTQVFLTASHDHVRTRLTHTLEVAQISRVTAKNLSLDPTLAEAIALGHDVGHTPFGHVGEKTLSHIMSNCDQLAAFQNFMKSEDKGFKHNLQSLRVTCDLEQLYGKIGLNLTNFTLWGIKYHTKDNWGSCKYFNEKERKCLLKRNPQDCREPDGIQLGFYKKYFDMLNINSSGKIAWSFEGQVVKEADEIAQRHHDIEDGIFMGIISNKELLEQINSNFSKYFDDEDRRLFDDLANSKDNNRIFLPLISKFIVGMLNKKLIENAVQNINRFIEENNILSRDDFINKYIDIDEKAATNVVQYEKHFQAAEKAFQDFLRNRILNSFAAQRMDGKGRFIIRRLFKAYITNPRQLHDSTIHFVFSLFKPDYKKWYQITPTDLGEMRNQVDSTSLKSDPRFMISLLRAICDHIAGMTDNFAVSEYNKLYGSEQEL